MTNNTLELVQGRPEQNTGLKKALIVSSIVGFLVAWVIGKKVYDNLENEKSVRADLNYSWLFDAFSNYRHNQNYVDNVPSHTSWYLMQKRDQYFQKICPNGTVRWHASGSWNISDYISCPEFIKYKWKINGLFDADAELQAWKNFLDNDTVFQWSLKELSMLGMYDGATVDDIKKSIEKYLNDKCEWQDGIVKHKPWRSQRLGLKEKAIVKTDKSCVLKKSYK